MSFKKIGSLQIEPEAASQNVLFWKIQKIAFIIFIVFLILVFLGLTGPGIFGTRKLESTDKSLTISYEPFTRRNSLNILQVTINDNTSNRSQVYFSSEYINKMAIKNITPTPMQVELKNGFIIYTFLGTSRFFKITFHFEPMQLGGYNLIVGRSESQLIHLKQWAYT